MHLNAHPFPGPHLSTFSITMPLGRVGQGKGSRWLQYGASQLHKLGKVPSLSEPERDPGRKGKQTICTCADHGPGTVPRTAFVFTTTLQRCYCYHLHFSDEKSVKHLTNQSPKDEKWWSCWDGSSSLMDSKVQTTDHYTYTSQRISRDDREKARRQWKGKERLGNLEVTWEP